MTEFRATVNAGIPRFGMMHLIVIGRLADDSVRHEPKSPVTSTHGKDCHGAVFLDRNSHCAYS